MKRVSCISLQAFTEWKCAPDSHHGEFREAGQKERRSATHKRLPLLRQRKPYLTGSPPSRQERRCRQECRVSQSIARDQGDVRTSVSLIFGFGPAKAGLGFLGGFLILAGDGDRVHDWPAEICKAHHGQFPAMLKRVE